MKTTEQFENEIKSQLDLSQNKIFEVFVNESDLRNYWNLEGDKNSPMMKKVYVPIFKGEIIGMSFEQSRAIRNLLNEAGVDTLKELENI